jgi:hypothetical protein
MSYRIYRIYRWRVGNARIYRIFDTVYTAYTAGESAMRAYTARLLNITPRIVCIAGSMRTVHRRAYYSPLL